MKKENKFQTILFRIAEFVDSNKYLSTIKNAFTFYIPFIIAGSLASLFNNVICNEVTGLASFDALNFLKVLSPFFTAVNYATMSIMSLVLVVLIGYLLGKENKIQPYFAAVIALVSFVSLIPQNAVGIAEDGSQVIVNALAADTFNARGLFLAMIVAILSVELLTRLMKIEKIKLSLPKGVPANIASSFNLLLPIAITIFTFGLIGYLTHELSGDYLNNLIYFILQKPLEVVVQHPAGILVLVLVSQILWVLGIHGGLVIAPIRNPLFVAALAANIAAVEAGLQPTNAVTMGYWFVFCGIGGSGTTLSLIVAIFIASKRSEHRAVAKFSLLPGLFGVSEPVVFGLPVVLNPVMAIPFVLAGMIAAALPLFATAINFIPAPVVDVPLGVPVILNALIGYQTINAVILQIIIFVICIFVYLPFVYMLNRATPSDDEEMIEAN